MNSVKEITDECYRLFELCDELDERIDVYYAKNKLNNSLIELNDEFEKDNFNESVLLEMKSKCEREAISLEFILSKFDKKLRERYLDRVEVAKLFESIDEIIRKESKNGYTNRDLIKDMLCNYALADRLLRNSNHILFSMSEEDKELMCVITKQIDMYRRSQSV